MCWFKKEAKNTQPRRISPPVPCYKRYGMAFALPKVAQRVPCHFGNRVKRLCGRRGRQLNMGPETQLNKEDFSETWQLYVLKVPPKLCNHTRKALKQHVLAVPRVHSVLRERDQHDALISLLLKYFVRRPASRFSDPPRGNACDRFVSCDGGAVADVLCMAQVKENAPREVAEFVAKITAGDLEQREICVGYEQWGLEHVLRNLLPPGVTVPSSFETVGHIAHLNLRDEHGLYKKVIGQVMLDKLQPRIRSVVNKLQSTGGPYRTFAMEVLAGDDNLETSVKENGCVYRLDFRRVYWNSRLETEHRKIVNSLQPSDVLADAFCGIGPFTVPAAKLKKCARVYANDLNPSSVEYLRQNAKSNHVEGDSFIISCGCARQFLQRIVRDEKVPVSRVVMNFPSGAPEFLDVFRGLYNGLREANMPMPLVNCYCFVKGVDDMDDARKRTRASLFKEESETTGRQILPDKEIDVREVRDVAPRKRQVCITFRVPEQVAYMSYQTESAAEPPLKKVKS